MSYTVNGKEMKTLLNVIAYLKGEMHKETGGDVGEIGAILNTLNDLPNHSVKTTNWYVENKQSDLLSVLSSGDDIDDKTLGGLVIGVNIQQ